MIAARRWPALLAGIAAACSRGAASPAPALDGVSIALYARRGGDADAVVDDRRWVDVAGGALVLDRIAPGAALSSLVIDPLGALGPLEDGAADLHLGACARAPASGPPAESAPVRCAAAGRPGRHRVRLIYLASQRASQLGFRVEHDVVVTAPDRAELASRFAITTPRLGGRADVVLYDAAPGGDRPPRELVRGSIALDGGVAVLAPAPRLVPVALRRIYDGAVHSADDPDPRDPRWGRESQPDVWLCLELRGLGETALAGGSVRVRVELPGEPVREREIDAPSAAAALGAPGGGLRIPLWSDQALRGVRDRWTEAPDDSLLSDRFVVAITNRGPAPREVWIEEPLRPMARRSVAHAWPAAPEIRGHRARIKLTVAPGAVERAGFAIDYER